MERQANRHAIEPPDRPLAPGVPVPPPLHERIHGQVFSTAAVPHHAADDPRDAREMGCEEGVEIECVVRSGFSRHGVAVRVHTSITSGSADL